jgi:hypothetical protein
MTAAQDEPDAPAANERLVLTLRARPGLPTHCFFLANARHASVIWTRDDFRALCHRMLNGNGEHEFLLCYRDAQDKHRFSKAYRAKASARIDWAFDTICGTAKQKTGIGFYPCNGDDESCWGALDFDAHNPEERIGRAYIFAGKAFDLLCREAPNLWLIAGTSGESGGWHVFVFAPFFYSTGEWARFLREVADRIGAPIQKGFCEIFPGNNRGLKYGIRAPGSWNPKDDSFGLIAFDGVTPHLKHDALPKEFDLFMSRSNACGKKPVLPSSGLLLPAIGEWAKAFAITSPRTRHGELIGLIGAAFYQAGRDLSKRNAEFQYANANPVPAASLCEHLREFDEAWSGMERQWCAKLSALERAAFKRLTTDTDRDAFRIIHNWSKSESPDFKIHCRTLADRLGVTLQTASNIRRRFCSLGILQHVARYVPHRLAARYKWTAGSKSKPKQDALISSQQWNGDPSDARLKRRNG